MVAMNFRIVLCTLNAPIFEQTRRDRLKSAPYLRLKNIQRTTIGNIWKNFFQKKILKFFFSKKVFFFRKSHNATKTQKEAIQAH